MVALNKGNRKAHLNGKDTRFKPGNPGGPGPPKLPEVVKEVRQINRNDVELLFNQCFSMTLDQLDLVINDPDSTAMQIAFAKCVKYAAEKGSLVHLEAILSRLLPPRPKPKEDEGLSPYQALRESMQKLLAEKINEQSK